MESRNNPQSEPYKLFSGPYNQEMPKLIADGRNPISPSLVFWRRLEALNEYLGAWKRSDFESLAEWDKVMETWWGNSVDTGFGIAMHPNGNAVLVPNTQYLRQLNLQTKLLHSYAVMPDGMFESLDGHRLTAAKINQYRMITMSQQQALADPLWKVFIPDKTLRDASIVNTFAQGKKDDMMGIYFPAAPARPVMGLWCFGGRYNRCNAYGGELISCSRLFGVTPGVAEGDVRTLEHIIQPK